MPIFVLFMANPKRTLEEVLRANEQKFNFKSKGERRIADFLDNNRIQYQYEAGVLVYQAKDKPRIWYPYVELKIM